MSTTDYTLALLGMVVITFGLRLSIIGLAGKFEISKRWQEVLEFVPIAVLSALIAVSTFVTDGQITDTLFDPKVLALIVCICCSLRFGLIATATAGMGTFWLFSWLL